MDMINHTNRCIYIFKFANSILIALLSIFIFLFGNQKLLSFHSNECKNILLPIIFMTVKSFILLFYIIIKSINNTNYYHSNKEGIIFLILMLFNFYNIRLLVDNSCNTILSNEFPYCYYFIFTYFIVEIFLGFPVLIYHSFIPLMRPKYNKEEIQDLVNKDVLY